MRRFYEQTLCILHKFLLANQDLHHGLLGVQMYFLAHLIELSKRLQPSDEGWEVAWVGVYNHGLARFIYFCTIAVLPAVSILALGKRELLQVQTQRWGSLSIRGASIDILNLLVLVGGMLLSSFLALWIWRNTPSRNGVTGPGVFNHLWKTLAQHTRRLSKKLIASISHKARPEQESGK
jgi:hypothetical protein